MTDDSRWDTGSVDPAAVAERLGLSLDTDGDATGGRADIERVVALAESLPSRVTNLTQATDVRTADDPQGALRYRFNLPTDGGALDIDLAVKANLAVAGVPTDCGAAVDPVVPEYTARVVERLRSAGARVVATTAMDELAYAATGTTGRQRVHNPVARDRVPGGSSSGSAAAVAGGSVAAALGTDTAGSVRIPASYCGVVGLKPTRGVFPRAGVVDLAPTLDHVGVLADSVGTTRRVLRAASGDDPSDPLARSGVSFDSTGADPAVTRVGVVEPAMESATPGVRTAVADGVERLADAGATVERVSLPEWGRAAPATVLVVGAELAALAATDGVVPGAAGGAVGQQLFRRLRERGAHGDGVRRGLVAHGGAVAASDGETYARAMTVRREVTAALRDALADVDVLVSPTTPTIAPLLDEADPASLRAVSNTAPANLTGHPAVSVPCGRSEGHPVGLQVLADYDDEATALAVAEAV